MGFKPNKYQEAIYDFILNGEGNAVINAVAGSGKCLGRDEEILMYDGTIKMVQDIVPGDLLMGDDSSPRRVLSTTKGYGKLKRIVPKKGKSFVCNDVHILTTDYYDHGDHYTIDISIPKIESCKKYGNIHPDGYLRYLKLLRTGVDFPKTETTIDPWLYGVWLGDGTKNQAEITNPDVEILNEINEVLPSGYYTKRFKHRETDCHIIRILCESHKKDTHKIRHEFRSSSDEHGKFIKREYLINGREERLKLLAGLLDTDGYLEKAGGFQITTKWERLGNQILFLARSLGFGAYMSRVMKRSGKGKEFAPYYSISISGDLDIIPTVVKRKRAQKRRICKNVLHVGFRIDDIGEGEYYGFTLDGNGRFLLSDFTITHNTSTIINSLDIIPKDKQILFLAFNKSIVDELKNKIGEKPNVQIRTLHSLGSSCCYNAFHSTINADKYVKYINRCIKDKKFKPTKKLTHDEMSSWARNIRHLCDLGRIELCTDQFSMREILTKHDILLEDNEIECAVKAIKWGETDVSEIDFSDMIYFPNIKKMDIPTFDFVFIDECQDLNAAQREFFLKCVDPDDGRFIGVGDKFQSIYGFAGSDIESFNKLVNTPNTVEYPLSVCYRCGKNIVEKAQKLVPQIEYKEGAEEGLIDMEAKLEDVKDGDMIICRVSAPLVSLCMKFIKDGVKAYVKGKDTGANLIGMLRKTGKDTVREAIDSMREEQHELIKKICNLNGYDEEEAQNTSTYQVYKDKFDAIRYLCEGYNKTEDVIKRIEEIFSDTNGEGICLSTVHKAKGLENDRVFILNEDKFYPKWAMRNKVQAVQEKNLEYVAITRPKKYLGYITYNVLI